MDSSPENLSEYEIRRRNIATSILSSDTDSVSPGTSVKPIKPRHDNQLRPPLLLRATYEGTSTERIRIPSTGSQEKEADRRFDRVTIPDKDEPELSRDTKCHNRAKSSFTAVAGLEREIHGPVKHSSLCELKSLPKSPLTTPNKVRKPRPSWIRSHSGSIWIQKHRSIHDDDSLTSETSSVDRVTAKTAAGMIIMPLVPPTPPSRPEQTTSRNSSVRVETPFPPVRDRLSVDSVHSNTPSAGRVVREASSKAQRLFLTPLTTLQKCIKHKPGPPRPSVTPYRDDLAPLREPRGHKSDLRRDQTSQILNRVSTLLVEVVKSSNKKKGIRVQTRESASTVSSIDPAELRLEKPNRGIAATFNIFKNRSLEDLQTMKTTTTSILEMQMGSTPQNTPLEIATYKVKRSPSQETEEFLKIDISVRGGTSYFPSEARRIHTSPLAEDNRHGSTHRRGFFFDYFPPDLYRGGSSEQQSYSQPDHTLGKTSQQTQHLLDPTSTDKVGSAPVLCCKRTNSSHTKPSHSSSQRTNKTKPRHNDWYETQLADLDALIPDTEMDLSQQTSHTSSSDKARHEHQTKLRDIRRQQFLDQLDWTIPEHLPSSPLCPRHPRY